MKFQSTNGYTIFIDDEDWELVGDLRWFVESKSQRTICTQTSLGLPQLHRYIYQYYYGVIPDGLVVSHVNKNRLDNRKVNLTLKTRQQASQGIRVWNSITGFKGVTRIHNGRYKARIWVNKANKSLGCFITPQEAARAYNEAAKKFFGDYAVLNVGA